MCCYSILSSSRHGIIRWCHDCKTFCVTYQNLVLTMVPDGFNQFKDSIEGYYHCHCQRTSQRNCRDVFLHTQLEGMQMLFSTNELGELLSLMQEAQLQHILIEYSKGV